MDLRRCFTRKSNITNGIDAGMAGLHVGANQNAIAARKAGRLRKPHVRLNTNPDQQKIGGERTAIGKTHTGKGIIDTVNGGECGASVKLHTMITMKRIKEGGYLRAGNAGKQPVRSLNHMHILAGLAQTCRRLKPDIATANDDGACRGPHDPAQVNGIIGGAQQMDTVQARCSRQLAGGGTGCQNQCVIWQSLIREDNMAGGSVNGGDHGPLYEAPMNRCRAPFQNPMGKCREDAAHRFVNYNCNCYV